MKRKELSRNRIIELYHRQSGQSYSVCRAILKANDWDLLKVYGVDLQGIGEGLCEAIGNFMKAFGEVAETLGRALNEAVDRMKIAQAKDVTEGV